MSEEVSAAAAMAAVPMDVDFVENVTSDTDTSAAENSASSSKLTLFSRPTKRSRDLAGKIRQVERRIMLGSLTDSEEESLRKSKYFSPRFEIFVGLSKKLNRANLYKKVTAVHLNEGMMADLQRKSETRSLKLRQKQVTKMHNLRAREKSIQEKVETGALTQADINNVLRDVYFVVKFGEHASLDHDDFYNKPANTMMAGEKLLCDFCQSSSERNRFGEQEDLLICKDCGNKAHPSCLSYSTDLVEQIRSDGSWQCIDCKACIICQGTGDADTLLFCDACDKGYHMQCHEPKLLQMPSGKWACGECQSKGKSVTTPVTAVAGDNSAPATAQPPPEKMKKKEVFFIADDDDDATKTNEANNKRAAPTHPTVPTKPSAVQQSPHPVIASVVSHAPKMAATATSRRLRVGEVKNVNLNGKSQQQQQQPQFVLGKGVHNNLNHIINPKLPLPDVRSSIREDVLRALPPDVADWTIDDVNYYFKSHGYVEESDLLKQQEMDGRALLLMTRRDCLTGMRIKLGPALKIYHMHIHKLQARTDFLC